MSLTRNIVGCWSPSLGASGYLLRDVSGLNNHGTLTNMDPGTDWMASPVGLVLQNTAIGSNKHVNCGTMSGEALNVPFTMTSWAWNIGVSPDGSPFAKTSESDGFRGPVIWINGGKTIAYWAGGTRATGATTVTGLTRWLLLGITWTGSQAVVYVNGLQDGIGSTTTAPNAAASSVNILRYSTVTVIRDMSGMVGESTIWRRALTDSEHAELYRRGNGWLGRELTGMNQRRTYGKKLGNRRRRLLCGGMT